MRKLFSQNGLLRLVIALVVFALLFPLVTTPVTADGSDRASRVHPLLQKLAKEKPSDKVRVIVLGGDSDDQLSTTVARKGGKNKKSLPLIKGCSAELTAKAATELLDNPDVKLVTIDAPMVPTEYIDTTRLATDYPWTIVAPELWNGSDRITGAGVGVAVIDSGITRGHDFNDPISGKLRIVESAKFNADARSMTDQYGHGTHVAGIIAGSGKALKGRYIGIAPQANLISVKVSDDQGMAYVSDVIESLFWIIQNRTAHNIRVVNLSLVSSVPEPYQVSPLCAAVEMAWLSGIVVVVSAGNLGQDTVLYPPANDPFVITVGAVDTNGTPDIADDVVPSWSSYGTTQDGFAKPEVVAPGRRIISTLASGGCVLAKQYHDRIVDKRYLQLSGTSMAAPVVSGVAALTLQAHPQWTPDQVKGALMATGRPLSSPGSGKGEVDAAAVVSLGSPVHANQGIPLNKGVAALAGTAVYDSAAWNSATWNSATWNSATWNSATWNSATWNSATWNSATWNSATWNSATWNSATWNSATWNSATWNSATWNSARPD